MKQNEIVTSGDIEIVTIILLEAGRLISLYF